MKTKFANYTVRLLVVAFACGAMACSFVNLAKTSAADNVQANNHWANQTESFQAESVDAAVNKSQTDSASQTQLQAIDGYYVYKTYREGKDGFDNSITIENTGRGKLHVSFSGNYVYKVNAKDETFHEAYGEGGAQLKGSVATGNLIVDGTGESCRVTLIFGGKQITVKAVNGCGLNVSPDGIYTKSQPPKQDIAGILGDAGDTPKTQLQTKPTTRAKDKPYVEYDIYNAAKALKNLMPTKADRDGCGSAVETFTGKIVKLIQPDIESYEFTISLSDGKRQKFYFALPEAGIELQDSDAVIVEGNTVTVKIIRCGNGGVPSPIEIISQ
ncbi:MAG: hypothetical protein M3033_03610 [Acidobacteriota bacterium]|nr:hypothetical protein [Acidobacteriota bacterium]